MMFFVTLPAVYFFYSSSKNPQTEHAFEAKLFVPQFCTGQISRCTQAHKLNAPTRQRRRQQNLPREISQIIFSCQPEMQQPTRRASFLPNFGVLHQCVACNFRGPKLEKIECSQEHICESERERESASVRVRSFRNHTTNNSGGVMF